MSHTNIKQGSHRVYDNLLGLHLGGASEYDQNRWNLFLFKFNWVMTNHLLQEFHHLQHEGVALLYYFYQKYLKTNRHFLKKHGSGQTLFLPTMKTGLCMPCE